VANPESGVQYAIAESAAIIVLARPSHFPKKQRDSSPVFRDISVPMRVVSLKPVW
jgi:hypothetical protein